MKNLVVLMSMFVFANLNAQNVVKMNADSTFKNKILVEASCGQCNFISSHSSLISFLVMDGRRSY